MAGFEEFKAYGDIARQMQSSTGRLALQEIVDNPDNRGVPLITQPLRERAYGSFDTINGMTLIAVDDSITQIAAEIIPPEDLSQQAFLELCRELNFPLQRKMVIDIEGLLRAVVDSRGHAIAGVSHVGNSQSNHGFAMLHVPNAYVGGGVAENIRSNNRGNDFLMGMNDMELSTTIASTLFDHFSGLILEQGT